MTDAYQSSSDITRRAIINSAVIESQMLLAAGRYDDAIEVLYAPKVLRAYAALHPEQSDVGAEAHP